MAVRKNPAFSAFVRGFALGRLVQRGSPIDYHRIQRLFGVSPATSKRDMAEMRRQGCEPTKAGSTG
jgi:hypothetical protein